MYIYILYYIYVCYIYIYYTNIVYIIYIIYNVYYVYYIYCINIVYYIYIYIYIICYILYYIYIYVCVFLCIYIYISFIQLIYPSSKVVNCSCFLTTCKLGCAPKCTSRPGSPDHLQPGFCEAAMKPFSEDVFAKEGSLSDTKVPVLPMFLIYSGQRQKSSSRIFHKQETLRSDQKW